MTTSVRNSYKVAVILLAFLAGCKTTHYAQVDTGNLQTYVPGSPNFNIGAIGLYNNNRIPSLHITINIPYSNLIFKTNNGNGTYYSKIEINLSVIRTVGSEKRQFIQTYEKEVRVASYKDTKGLGEYSFKINYVTPAGEYLVEARVTDKNSNKSAYNQTKTVIPNLNTKPIDTGNIRLLGKYPSLKDSVSKFRPLVNYSLEEGMDSLKASIQLFLKNPNNNLNLSMYLFKFRSDTLPAKPPQYLTPSQGSLAYQGIDFRKKDTLEATTRNYKGISGLIEVDFTLPHLSDGNYRLIVEGKSPDTKLDFEKIRDFSMKSPGYPRLITLRELARATVYIATPKEYKKIMKSLYSDSLKSVFDSFWGKLIANKELAKSVLASYYSRVQEANMLYSTYKEGWKTDPGMVYILYGTPSYVEKGVDGMIWYYSNSTDNISSAFYFIRARNFNGYFPYEHYILRRSMLYEVSWNSMVEDWRSGLIN